MYLYIYTYYICVYKCMHKMYIHVYRYGYIHIYMCIYACNINTFMSEYTRMRIRYESYSNSEDSGERTFPACFSNSSKTSEGNP
jgi:hypothetical protein